MITSVWLHRFVKTRLTQGLSLSGGRLSGVVSRDLLRATHAFPVGHGCTVVVLAGTPTSVPQSPGSLCGKAPYLLGVVVGVVGVVTSCGLCVRVSRKCATENTCMFLYVLEDFLQVLLIGDLHFVEF